MFCADGVRPTPTFPPKIVSRQARLSVVARWRTLAHPRGASCAALAPAEGTGHRARTWTEAGLLLWLQGMAHITTRGAREGTGWAVVTARLRLDTRSAGQQHACAQQARYAQGPADLPGGRRRRRSLPSPGFSPLLAGRECAPEPPHAAPHDPQTRLGRPNVALLLPAP
jgi:hypothetical protein